MPYGSTVDVTEILVKGGEQRVALLRYCVISRDGGTLFVFLDAGVSMAPTHVAALAFTMSSALRRACKGSHVGRAAPAKPDASGNCPVDPAAVGPTPGQEQPDQDSTVSITTPHRNLFDPLWPRVQRCPGSFRTARRSI